MIRPIIAQKGKNVLNNRKPAAEEIVTDRAMECRSV